ELLDRLRLLEQERPCRAGVPPELPPLLRELARHGPLTPFQEDWIAANRGLELVLGPYLLVDRIGSGGMGEIYQARDRRDGRRAALKVLRPETLAKAENRRRFEREIRALSRLDHANIVGSLGADLAGKRPYLAMEYVEGTDLGAWVERHG